MNMLSMPTKKNSDWFLTKKHEFLLVELNGVSGSGNKIYKLTSATVVTWRQVVDRKTLI